MKKILALIFCLAADGVFAARPHDPFILRVVFRNKPRMVLLALDPMLSVGYDSPTCGLYIAWKGGVQPTVDAYNHQAHGNHGATYYPRGNAEGTLYPNNKITFKMTPGGEISETDPPDTRDKTHVSVNDTLVPVWSATQGGQPLVLKPDYRGYTVNNTLQTATLRYNLNLPSGAPIQVTELPDSKVNSTFVDLTRVFTVSALPAGTKLSLLLSSNPIRKADASLVVETWTATGTGRIETVSGKSYFVAEANGSTTVTGSWR